MKGLAPQTSELFDAITRLECIKPFVLVGGTALSLQIHTRQSEDLDFISSMKPIVYQNNLCLADIKSIGAMKMETMLRRAKFRDYYDLYSILQSGIDIHDLIPIALEHSGYKLKQKNLLAMITNGDYYKKDSTFAQLQPVYDVTAFEIQEYIKEKLLEGKPHQN